MTPSQDLPDKTWRKDFILTWLGRFGIFLAHHITRPLLPLYLITFGASSTVIGAVMAVFTITTLVSRIPVGMYIDRIGRKPFLLYGIALFCIGKLGYLWSPSIALMLPFRVLHGLGWSGCTTAVSTLSADIVPQTRRGDLMGYAGMASSVASALGPVLGFALYHRYHFAGAFLGAAAMLLLSFVVSVPVTEPAKAQAPAQKPAHWLDNIIVKETVAPAIGVAFLSFGHGGILTFLPIHALKIGLENPGLWFGVYAVCILASRPIAGPLSDKVSRQAVIIPGLILNLLGIIILAFSTSSIGIDGSRGHRRLRHRRGPTGIDDRRRRPEQRQAARPIIGPISIRLRSRHRRWLFNPRRAARFGASKLFNHVSRHSRRGAHRFVL